MSQRFESATICILKDIMDVIQKLKSVYFDVKRKTNNLRNPTYYRKDEKPVDVTMMAAMIFTVEI